MNTLLLKNTKSARGLLVKCLAISIAAHVVALVFFYYHPLILQGPLQSLFGISSATPSLLETQEETELAKKNEELREAFEKILVFSPHLQQPYDLAELPKGVPLAPTDEAVEFRPAPKTPSMDALDQKFAAATPAHLQESEEQNIPAFFAAPEIGSPIASALQVDAEPFIPEVPNVALPDAPFSDLIALSEYSLRASFEADYSLKLSQTMVASDDLQLKTETKPIAGQASALPIDLDKEHSRSTLFIPKGQNTPHDRVDVSVAPRMAEIDEYEFPALAMAAAWNDDFNADVAFLPNPEGKGYLFSVSLTPNVDLSNHSLKQNLYFIIDRSNSVQKHRFAVFKRAVLKALASMQQGDAFNILILDKKLARFSPAPLAVSMKNIQAAEEFLDKQEAGGLFSAGEIYNSLGKVLETIPDNDEMHTAILLTDGKTDMNPARKQASFKNWIAANNGKVSLYTAAIGRENDLVSLDLLSSISGGTLLYSDTHASFPRKLAKLVLDLKDPLAKDLMITAVPHNPNSRIEFYHASSHLPTLYSHQPYVLIGQIDDPCAFDIVLQGRHKDQWVAIKKYVSFVEGHKADRSLVKEWNGQRANLCYAEFLRQGKASQLKEAKEILKASRSEIAFE